MATYLKAIAMIMIPYIILIVCRSGHDHVSTSTAKIRHPEPAVFDIFLSFRGNDSRENFASVLYGGMHRAGLRVFKDDESIRGGDHIGSKIEEAIRNSKAAVILLSTDFASSKWCLDELVLILEQKSMLGSKYVLKPIYLEGVEFDDVRKQRGSYATALAKHNKPCGYLHSWNSCSSSSGTRVKEWRAALKQITGHRGKKLIGNWDKFINEMVEEIREDFRTTLGIKVDPRHPISTGVEVDPTMMEKNSGTIMHKTMVESIENVNVGSINIVQNQEQYNVIIMYSSALCTIATLLICSILVIHYRSSSKRREEENEEIRARRKACTKLKVLKARAKNHKS